MKSNKNIFKFRVWNETTKNFCQFRPANDPEWFAYIVGDPVMNNHITKDMGVIEPCTGLPDKKKVLAYVGDIVRQHYNNKSFLDWVVFWNGKEGSFFIKYIYDHELYKPLDKSWLSRRIIVGNIHQHPELLRRKSK